MTPSLLYRHLCYGSVVDDVNRGNNPREVPESEDDPVDSRRVAAFGTRVREVRESQGLTQEKLADAAGLHRAVIGFVERAEREVGLSNAWRIADGLGMTLSELLQGVDSRWQPVRARS